MADEKIIEEVRVLKRGGGTSAIFATLATVIAIVAIVFAVRADNQEHSLQAQLNKTNNVVINLNKQVIKTANSIDQSSANAANASTTTVPNGSGQ